MFKPAMRRGFAILVTLIILMAHPVGAQPNDDKPIDSIRVTFVNVGSGLCTVIECPGDQFNPKPAPVLYDCGSSSTIGALSQEAAVDFVQTILGYYPHTRPKVVVSHPEVDHYKYIARILTEDFRNAESVSLGGDPDAYNHADFQNWLNRQRLNGAQINTFTEGGSGPLFLCGTAPAGVLTVNAGDGNAQSVVLRIEHKEFSVTLTGDATAESLASLLSNNRTQIGSLATVLLSAPHHGAISAGSNSFVWPQVFQPRIVVYSAGSQHHHPRCEALVNYHDFNSMRNAQAHPLRCGEGGGQDRDVDSDKAQYLTRTNGSIWITSNGQNFVTVNCDQANCALR